MNIQKINFLTAERLLDIQRNNIQMLHVDGNNEMYQGLYQKQLNYFKRQFFIAEDIVMMP
jgi:hypothetical protein